MNDPIRLKTYRVRVGHWQLTVKAHDVQEAIEVARRKLSTELPRLYDVIRALTPAQFQIEHAA